MKCKLCKEYYEKYPLQDIEDDIDQIGKHHKIDDHYFISPIKCAFEEKFKSNWNCQTVNLIRDLCYEGQELKRGITYTYCDDMKYAVIKIDDVRLNDEYIGIALFIAWYKQRGRTDTLWILDSCDKPRRPTEKELLTIVKFYNKGE